MADENSINNESHDLNALFSSEGRDFLIRNNGDKVEIKALSGKIVGLYFSASWCPPCRGFTPKLIETYKELSSKGDFEVVFVSADRDEESFNGYFSKMPWLAIPFSDSTVKDGLDAKFNVMGIPHLVILNGEGKVLTDAGVELVMEHQAEAYPFTPERINQLKEEEEAAKRNQNLKSLLVSSTRDYLVSSDGNKTSVANLEGNTVGLYFYVGADEDCVEFTPKLVNVYNKVKENGEKFEVVLIYLDERDEDGFKEELSKMPWLALPFKDIKIEKLARYFELRSIPTLVIIGPDGKTQNLDVVELIQEHGVTAYPFTPNKLAELAEIEKAKLESQTLESILVSGEKDYVIDKTGSKVPVSQLVGKHVLIYFSAHWCPPCRGFTPKLVETYNEMKAKGNAIEVIFASSDQDQSSFDEYYSEMPWLALPFGDERKALLSRKFKVKGIPCLVAIGPEGKTITTETRHLIDTHGSDAFPFTEDHIEDLKQKLEDIAKGWPEKVKHELHEHELVKVRRNGYYCDECTTPGNGWSFWCEECDYDLDPKCALANSKEVEEDAKGETKEGYICEGDVCRKI
ncbi:putative nucleoredoxin 1 [Silene latifolia]|uniref:putative nucleoredoxin 1 n=1 Tax=Silene latifolia TaxID=37657 RepID=UPI003D789826